MVNQMSSNCFILISLFFSFFSFQNIADAQISKYSFSEEDIKAALDINEYIEVPKDKAVDMLKTYNIHISPQLLVNDLDATMVNNILAAVVLLQSHFNFILPRLIVDKGSASRNTRGVDAEFITTMPQLGQKVYQFLIYEEWKKRSSFFRVGVFLHELSHLVGNFAASVDTADLWCSIEGGWSSFHGGTPLHKDKYVSEYAMTRCDEDWAESLVVYLIAPAKLKNISQNKYLFIDSIFTESKRINPLMITSYFSKKDLKKVRLTSDYKTCINFYGKENKLSCLAQVLLDTRKSYYDLVVKLKENSYAFFLGLRLINTKR
jgi:hypothetical protein